MFSFYLILFSISCVSNHNVLWPEVLRDQFGTNITNHRLAQKTTSFNNVETGDSRILKVRSVRSTTCILPAYPRYGTYYGINANNSKPGQVYDSFILTVSCRRGYGLDKADVPYGGSTLVLCVNGVWSQTMPKCVRFCKLDPDPSVLYMCHMPGVGLKSCHGHIAPGTLINPVCNVPNYDSTEILPNMECLFGFWNYIAKCKAECGRVTAEGGMSLIIDGEDANRGQVPWHVGIYRKTSTPYEQICGGSIISNNVIISAAHCFWNRTHKSLPPSDYGVAGGKIYRLWNDKKDVTAQKSDVKEIKIPRLFQGADASYGEDIAVLILVTSFVYNSFVRPVCLNFDAIFNSWQLQDGKLGKAAGWGLTSANGDASPTLQVVDLPFINEDTCINTVPPSFRTYITGDKFCAGYTNGTALCKGDSGGGLAFPDKELGKDRFYLRGIVSTAPTSDNKVCNENTYITFTKISKHQEFIVSVIAVGEKKPCQGVDCIAVHEYTEDSEERGPQPQASTDRTSPKHGEIKLNNHHPTKSDDFEDEESCEWMGIKGKCVPAKVCFTTLDKDGEKHPMCPDRNGKTNYICCTDCQLVNDTSDFVISSGADILWKDGRKARDACLQYLKDVPHKCYQEGYSAGITRRLDTGRQCHSYHTWGVEDRDPPSGWEHPYLAVLGYGDRLETATWLVTGTIITENFILITAYRTQLDNEPVKYAALGKKNNKWVKDWLTYTVKKTYLHPAYKEERKRGGSSFYNDIALIELETPITFSADILPACLPEPAENMDITSAKYFYWWANKTVDFQKITTKECDAQIMDVDKRFLPQMIKRESQLCYSSNTTCVSYWDYLGVPLTVTTQYSRCINTVIGLYSWQLSCETAVFTRVKHYTPWIESIVWHATTQ